MAAYPSGTNTFVPSFDAGGHLVVSYSRNVKDFPINKYVTITGVKRNAGYYLRLTAEQAARVIESDLSEFIWPDSNEAPDQSWGTESFNFQPYLTTRRSYGFRLGYLAAEQADWQIEAQHAAIAAAQAMTARSLLTLAKLEDAANYDSGHSTTAKLWANTSLFWDAGTAANPTIKKTLLAAAQKINIDTLGVVKTKDLQLVINPVIASRMATSEEIHAYLQQSPYSLAQVRGDAPSQNGQWGLPDQIYTFPIVIEDTVKVTSKKGETKVSGYAKSSNSAQLVARPGGLTSNEGGVSFSTFHLFMKEEMTVETKDDVDNRRRVGRVVEDFSVESVAPSSGCNITNLFS